MPDALPSPRSSAAAPPAPAGAPAPSPAPASAPASPATRHWELDALRGLMLVLMTITHLPTRLTSPLGQPFGYVSAAEGFVLLSAYMAGLVYGRVGHRKGIPAMRAALLARARKVYSCHVGMLVFLFTVIAFVGLRTHQPAVQNLMYFYLQQPVAALASSLLLVYQPSLLDILPMYVLFMLASPWVLSVGMRRGWRWPLAASLALWGIEQFFSLGGWLHAAAVRFTGLPVPLRDTGSFATFAWQLLWMVGLWMGASRNDADAKPIVFPRPVVWLAVAVAVAGLAWRHDVGQAPFLGDVQRNLWFDKWLLGPLRLLDLAALAIVTIRFGPALARRIPRPRWLETMGAASLAVFCAHLVIVLLVLATLGSDPLAHPAWVDAVVLVLCYGGLWLTARGMLWLDRQKTDDDQPPWPLSPSLAAPPVRRGAGPGSSGARSS
jgi:hypothetical protein